MASWLANELDCISIVWSADEQNSIVKKMSVHLIGQAKGRSLLVMKSFTAVKFRCSIQACTIFHYPTRCKCKNLPHGCMLSGLCCMLNDVLKNGGVTECFIAVISCSNHNCSCFQCLIRPKSKIIQIGKVRFVWVGKCRHFLGLVTYFFCLSLSVYIRS